MNSLGGIMKLRTFCEIARDAGYRWAWNEPYYIDRSNDVELQESLNSMFVWYRHSALTIVYLLSMCEERGNDTDGVGQ
ncbi:hypothetical protein EDB19DRAFT_1715060 [Suillus lakei]|nr:hypothetical protein EDB19DRAFT_1715060 [Suillus lakei]